MGLLTLPTKRAFRSQHSRNILAFRAKRHTHTNLVCAPAQRITQHTKNPDAQLGMDSPPFLRKSRAELRSKLRKLRSLMTENT